MPNDHDAPRATPWPDDVDLVKVRLRIPRELLDALDALVERIPYDDADRELALVLALTFGLQAAHRAADDMDATRLALGSLTRGET